MKLRLSQEYVIDTDDYRKEGLRIAILAMSGHGKSNAATDIVEDVLDQKSQAIILEPIIEWHTLKARSMPSDVSFYKMRLFMVTVVVSLNLQKGRIVDLVWDF